MRSPASVAYLVDPRFPGGTSSAVAFELRECTKLGHVSVHAIESQMFSSRTVAPQLAETLSALGLELIWDSRTISADVVILHNPTFLKFQATLESRILARHLIVVAHENFLRPGAAESFDVNRCLNQIDRASLALRKTIAPISKVNRKTVLDWLKGNDLRGNWAVLESDWFNICAFPMIAPNTTPADRRGRHSRPGFEKFPNLADMDLCFPAHAEANVILGADHYLADRLRRPHWSMHPFQSFEVPVFFGMIDFMVYFTAPTWRESFGRVLAEAIAAGKVVISDPQTAATFDGGVVAGTPAQVDEIISGFIADPKSYHMHVAAAQAKLSPFSAQAFRAHLSRILTQAIGATA